MTIFELVKIALDELYKEGMEEYGSKLDETISKRIVYLADSYKKLGSDDREAIDYSDPATRFAYVYKYVASHGDYLVQTLQSARSTLGGELFEGDALRLSCVGGGPGSDVIGVLKYLSDFPSEPTSKLTCYLLDGEQAWADTWTEIVDSLRSDLAINVNFQRLDVTDPASWSTQKKFLKADIFTLSYFVSEVFSSGSGVVADFWRKLFDEAKPGALFIYIDNGSEAFNNYFDAQWSNRTDLEAVLTEDNERITPRFTEQASELGDYRIKFNQSPKIQSKISYRVLRKT